MNYIQYFQTPAAPLTANNIKGGLSIIKELARRGLNKAGKVYHKIADYPLSVPMTTPGGVGPGNPYMTGTSNGDIYHYASTPKKELQQAMIMSSGLVLPVSIGTLGVGETVGGTVAGMGGASAGKYVGNKAADVLELSPEGRELVTDAGAVVGGLYGGAKGTKAGKSTENNIRYTVNRLAENKEAWYAPFEYMTAHSPMGKRAIEVVMRATPRANPLPAFIKRMQDPIHRNGAIKYILFNSKKGLKDYRFAHDQWTHKALYDNSYNGSSTSPYFNQPGETDLVSAYLYGENLPLKRTEGYGVHSAYVKSKYPNKDIPVYEIPGSYIKDPVISTRKTKGLVDSFEFFGKDGRQQYLNTSGHLLEGGLTNKGQAVCRRQDIWKFNPKEYISRWGEIINDLGSSASGVNNIFKNSKIIDFGVHAVDEAGTPIIIRTPWQEYHALDLLNQDDPLNYLSYFKSGGSIHIKPENKGKFTETKKRTGKTTEELTHSKNPLTRKRAIFAQTVKKWNHKK